MPTTLSKTMETALALARREGRLVWLRGSYWVPPSKSHLLPHEYAGTRTVKALEARGHLRVDPDTCVQVLAGGWADRIVAEEGTD